MRSVIILCITLHFLITAAFADVSKIDPSVSDQNGINKKFFAEVIGDQPVIVNFIYTRCEGVCPGQGQRFQLLQKALGHRLGKDVKLVSVSIDPEVDTPTELKKWSELYGATLHWTLVTSTRASIDLITKELIGMTVTRAEHSPFVAVRGTKGKWQRLYGLSSAREIIGALNEG